MHATPQESSAAKPLASASKANPIISNSTGEHKAFCSGDDSHIAGHGSLACSLSHSLLAGINRPFV